MANIQERVENLTGGNSSSSSLPIAVDIATSFLTSVVKSIGYNTPVQDSVDMEDKPLAVLSKVSYDNYFSGNVNETQKMIDDYNIGYNIVEDLTKKEYITAVNPQDKKVVIAFKGTDPTLTNIYDDIADLEIGLGLAETPLLSYIPSRFNTAENIYKEVKNKYPDYEINLTGHSLGGTTARYVGDRYNEKAVVFSAGATPLEPFLNKELEIAPSKAKFYLTDTLDVISNTSRLTEHNVNIVRTKDTYRKYFTGSHSIENYLPEITKINPISKKINENEIIPKTIKTQFNALNVNTNVNTNVNVNKEIKTSAKIIGDVVNNVISDVRSEIVNKKMNKMKERNENVNVSEPFRKSLCELKPYLCYGEKK